MKDYIKEFGDDQAHKKLPVKFELPDERGFEPDIRNLPSEDEPTRIDPEDLKSFAVEAVLKYMNESLDLPTPPEPYELLEDHKKEIIKKIKLYESRSGFLGTYFLEQPDINECGIGAIIDPTNTKNWCLIKQEIIHRLPYSYKECLYKLFKESKENRD